MPSLGEALRFWLKLGFISFGGPAGQIAIMRQELVERRRWISERRFLHALNYCMLLPGPEAQQLATYIGWLMHRTWGGIVAGGLFVLPSLHEGIPMVLLEALALQRPVVATRVGGIPEVIQDGQTGLLAEPSDASSLAMLIQQMIEDPSLAVSLGNAGRTRVETEFTARTMAGNTAELYEQVLRTGS